MIKRIQAIAVAQILLFSLFLSGCGSLTEKKNIDVSYQVCSEMYNCSSELTGELANAIHFRLPVNHSAMYVTFITEESGEFQQDMTDAVSQFPPAKGIEYSGVERIGTFNAQGDTFGFDAVSAAINAMAAGVEVFIAYYETGDSNAAVRRAMEIMSGYTNVTYHYVVYNAENEQLYSGTAPGGIKVTLFCSDEADRIDFYATESGNLGRVAYENAYEIDTREYEVEGGKSGDAFYSYYGDVGIEQEHYLGWNASELEDEFIDYK